MKAVANLKDSEFNAFLRPWDLDNLHYYLRHVSDARRVEHKPVPSKYLDESLLKEMDKFALEFDGEVDFVKSLNNFWLQVGRKGDYRLTLIFDNSQLTFAKKIFTTLGKNRSQLKTLRGVQTSTRGNNSKTFYSYQIEVNCFFNNVLSGGVYNLALIVYVLTKLGK